MILAPKYNSDGNDAIGAFQPESREFCRTHNLPFDAIRLFDNSRSMPARAAECTSILTSHAGLFDTVGFFCHGWAPSDEPHGAHTLGIQAGWTKGTLHQWAQALKAACTNA